MAVYLIGAIDIEDAERYGRYVQDAGKSMAGHTIEALAVDDEPTLLEGDLPAGRIILMRFETEEEMQAWYKSDGYQDAMKHRLAGAKTRFLVAIEGAFTPPT